ncbi:MAG: leucyl/phenylalanyl-tRNA--protein transferase [Cycloclasticus sp.]|nr:MAG: leucyl/phenylalanyl-tRNA--protein transferase [Cycloclasticus sp.]
MLPWLNADDDTEDFPDLDNALTDPNGLLAAGGSLSPERLLKAYRAGIFPWFEDDQPILWWSPDPRMVLRPAEIHLSKSLQKVLKKAEFNCTYDRDFSAVIQACAQRSDEEGTWITGSMKKAYQALHAIGYAHSIEVWKNNQLVGGLYGVAIGQFYFGESMFSRCSNASKVGFAFLMENLQEWQYQYVDCQLQSNHLETLGAYEISRNDFSTLLDKYCPRKVSIDAWVCDK